MNGARIAALRSRMIESSLDALIVSSLANIRYLTGFSGSNALVVVTGKRAYFVSDSRYALLSAHEVRKFRRIIGRGGLLEDASAAGTLRGCRDAGFESDSLTYAQYRSIGKNFPGVRFHPAPGLVEGLALVKDARELKAIEEAAAVSDSVFSGILRSLRPGATESDPFDVIVASGERGALPHARPTSRRLRRGEFVILDFGSTVRGYCSDMTRTVSLGRAPARLRAAYAAVLEANESAAASARAGIEAKNLDAVARSCLRRRGFGKFFTHSLGHGIGLRVHERPRSFLQAVKQLFRPISRLVCHWGILVV